MGVFFHLPPRLCFRSYKKGFISRIARVLYVAILAFIILCSCFLKSSAYLNGDLCFRGSDYRAMNPCILIATNLILSSSDNLGWSAIGNLDMVLNERC